MPKIKKHQQSMECNVCGIELKPTGGNPDGDYVCKDCKERCNEALSKFRMWYIERNWRIDDTLPIEA